MFSESKTTARDEQMKNYFIFGVSTVLISSASFANEETTVTEQHLQENYTDCATYNSLVDELANNGVISNSDLFKSCVEDLTLTLDVRDYPYDIGWVQDWSGNPYDTSNLIYFDISNSLNGEARIYSAIDNIVSNGNKAKVVITTLKEQASGLPVESNPELVFLSTKASYDSPGCGVCSTFVVDKSYSKTQVNFTKNKGERIQRVQIFELK